jgi:Heavy-metal resistance
MSEQTTTTEAVSAPEPPSARPRRTRTLLLMLAVFLCGGVCGASLAVAVVVHRMRGAVLHPDRLPGRTAQRLTRRLNLTPEQQAQVESILERHHQTMRPMIGRQMHAMRGEIEAVLTPEQMEEWESMGRRWRRTTPEEPTGPRDRRRR